MIRANLAIDFEVVALGGGGININADFIIRFKIFRKSADLN